MATLDCAWRMKHGVAVLSNICGSLKYADNCQGTGSYPPLHQGLQRRMRQTVNRIPRKKPYFAKASQAYSEQVGVKRHDGAIKGLMQY